VLLAGEHLEGTDVEVCSVVGFPHGNSKPSVKIFETEQALEDGASEIDMVVNIGKVLSKDWAYITGEIMAVNQACVSRGAILKVIFENDFLPADEYKIKLCELCSEAKVAFVKTSTGYGFTKQASGEYNYFGATDHDLMLMRKYCDLKVQVKAAGGVRTLDDLLRVKSLGVTRAGATATEAILIAAKLRGYT
jgi:deoxyribose-phosphate aldolase